MKPVSKTLIPIILLSARCIALPCVQSFPNKEIVNKTLLPLPPPDTNARLTIEFRNISPTRHTTFNAASEENLKWVSASYLCVDD